jgi:putative membrane protein (TIGR04086 family)
MILAFIFSGFLKGKKSAKNGYIQGLKIGSFLVLILIILGTITFNFSFKSILYYIILILSAIFGAMLGINKKK